MTADDLAGLHLMRNRAPPGMNIAAGEYSYEIFYFKRMLEAKAVEMYCKLMQRAVVGLQVFFKLVI